MVKNPLANAGDAKDEGSASWSGRFPWKRRWQPTPVFLQDNLMDGRLQSIQSQSWTQLSDYVHMPPWNLKKNMSTEIETHKVIRVPVFQLYPEARYQ